MLYLRGVSTKDFVPALADFFGSEAGLSASTISRLTREWSLDLEQFKRRDLSQVDYVYVRADGVHLNIRLEEDRLCCLVLVGVRADGKKELIAVGDYGAKYPKVAAKLVKDREPLLAHFAFPAEHWIHLRSTNAIESTLATVRLRTHKTKGAGSRAAGLAMTYKLLEAAEQRWRCVNAPYLVALVRAGATFVDGVKVEREDTRDVA